MVMIEYIVGCAVNGQPAKTDLMHSERGDSTTHFLVSANETRKNVVKGETAKTHLLVSQGGNSKHKPLAQRFAVQSR